MNKLVFVDLTCNKPYDPTILAQEPLGGTEATVIRVAEGLATDFEVSVFQHNRKTTEISENGVMYKPLDALSTVKRPKNVVLLRDHKALAFLKEQYPDAKLFLWLHDLADGQPAPLAVDANLLIATRPTIITVSKFHKQNVKDVLLSQAEIFGEVTVKFIHNPIDDELKPNGLLPDINKLVYFSSPHKGLRQVLRNFEFCKRQIPELKLYISNPGYYEDAIDLPKDVIDLGKLSHEEVMQHVREAFCVFYPSAVYKYRETFGLVFAEANAVGTPVIAHPMGAAPEILNNTDQLVDARDEMAVLDRLQLWRRQGRPLVRAKEQFRASVIAKDWKNILRDN